MLSRFHQRLDVHYCVRLCPSSAVSTVTLIFVLLNLMHSFCPIVHRWCKFTENLLNAFFQNIMVDLITFRNAHTTWHERTHAQKNSTKSRYLQLHYIGLKYKETCMDKQELRVLVDVRQDFTITAMRWTACSRRPSAALSCCWCWGWGWGWGCWCCCVVLCLSASICFSREIDAESSVVALILLNPRCNTVHNISFTYLFVNQLIS